MLWNQNLVFCYNVGAKIVVLDALKFQLTIFQREFFLLLACFLSGLLSKVAFAATLKNANKARKPSKITKSAPINWKMIKFCFQRIQNLHQNVKKQQNCKGLKWHFWSDFLLHCPLWYDQQCKSDLYKGLSEFWSCKVLLLYGQRFLWMYRKTKGALSSLTAFAQ